MTKSKLGTGKLITALSMVAFVLIAIIPKLAFGLFSALGWIFSALGAGFILLASWFAKASDEPHEKAIWGGLLLVLTVALVYYFGLSLIDYWWLILFVAFVFAVAMLNVIWKERRRKK